MFLSRQRRLADECNAKMELLLAQELLDDNEQFDEGLLEMQLAHHGRVMRTLAGGVQALKKLQIQQLGQVKELDRNNIMLAADGDDSAILGLEQKQKLDTSFSSANERIIKWHEMLAQLLSTVDVLMRQHLRAKLPEPNWN